MASDLFENIFHSGSSGCVRTCECGKTYFDGEDTTIDWEEGELEALREKAEKNPDMFLEVDFSIPTIDIAGRQYIFDCSCNGADPYENFINDHASQIAEYLNKKAEQLRSKANDIEVKNA